MKTPMITRLLPLFVMCPFLHALSPAIPLEPVVNANTALAVDLYHQFRTGDGNLFFSPYSISSAMAMAWAGARGNTAEEMQKALNFSDENETVNLGFQLLNDRMQSMARESQQQLNIANGLCLVGGDLSADFKALLKEAYDAEIFGGDLEVINRWVAEKTRGKIETILDELDPNTVAVILNAIYFKGEWAHAFDADRTRSQPFSISPEQTRDVELMYRKGTYKYLAHDDYQAVTLPYRGDRFTLDVILPTERHGLAALEEKMDAETLAEWLQDLDKARSREIELFLPRMKMETDYNLVKPFQVLGIQDAFKEGIADFQGMGWPVGELWIGDIVHKAFLEVNEEGTEAAAATAVVMVTRAAPMEPPVFRADHPFLFIIRENSTGSILFMGRMSGPATSE
ncbi:MAG: hypothetical protein JJU29_09030 [Verrucomicrobia bacterium]|nr:hypothetical protein [Verrucomicrobiota bacterium]